jgi:hypothetical protein
VQQQLVFLSSLEASCFRSRKFPSKSCTVLYCLQMMDEAGPEHLADVLGPDHLAELLMDIDRMGEASASPR